MGSLAEIKSNYESLKRSLSSFHKAFIGGGVSLRDIVSHIGLVLLGTDEGRKIVFELKRKYRKVKIRGSFIFIRVKFLANTLYCFVLNSPSALIKSIKTTIIYIYKITSSLVNKLPLGDFGKEKELKVLVITILAIFMLGIISCLIILCITIYNEKLYVKEFCLSDKCVSYFFGRFNGISIILQSIAWLITLITTVGGIGIALLTYKAGVKNSNLTNHISHLNMFRDYMNAEINKRKFISPDKVNIYKWYSLIFPLSKKGDVTVSSSYKLKVDAIADVVFSANREITEPGGKYIYTNHQVSLLEKVGDLGIKISTGPKNDFILIEEQVFELIDCINITFTDVDTILTDIKRSYI
ncbi:hypothetical protein I6U06_07035 [Klebsiella pneumoniae]|uniref:retron Ec48 family effector membrane protein n=1 Tax=Klebsiella pneumoniae TaxID=573 RepID=UPI0022EA56CF|nr:retron Ec48 family effector membrane protein [Klebsiella pneumoniae]MDA3141788.1 hypothetical protein [Klebsiella pneumoniae]